MIDTASAPNREKRIVTLLRRSVWYVLPLVVVIGCLLVAVRLATPSGVEPVNGADNTSNGADSTTGDDALVCAEPDWNFGSVDQDTPKKSVNHEFVVKNRSNQAITINRITTNCGCAVAESSLGTVPPFGETTVRMKLNVTGRPGPVSKHSIVFYRDEFADDGAKTLQLTMHGIINWQRLADNHAEIRRLRYGQLNE